MHSKQRLNREELLLVLNFFPNLKEMVKMLQVSRRMQYILSLYEYNPIEEVSAFPRIHTHFMYSADAPTIRGVNEVVLYEVSILEAIKHMRIGRLCKRTIFTKEDRDVLGDQIPLSVFVKRPRCAVCEVDTEETGSDVMKIDLDITPSIHENTFRNDTEVTVVTFRNIRKVNPHAFEGCTSLTCFSADYVGILGSHCFTNCTSLETVAIGHLEMFGENCFKGCKSIQQCSIAHIGYPVYESIVSYSLAMELFKSNVLTPTVIFTTDDKNRYGEKVPMNIPIHMIDDGVFENSRVSMRDVMIPRSVISLGNRCFFGCSTLSNITFSSGLKSIGDQCFYGCSRLESLNFPSSLTHIGDNAFDCCEQLTMLSLPSSIRTLDAQVSYGVFKNLLHPNGIICTNLCYTPSDRQLFGDSIPVDYLVSKLADDCFKEVGTLKSIGSTSKSGKSIKLPTTLTSLGQNCFEGCSSLKTANLTTITSLGDGCFKDCGSLTSVILSSDITSIPPYCFEGCTSLEYIQLPQSVSLGPHCFKGCKKLEGVIGTVINY